MRKTLIGLLLIASLLFGCSKNKQSSSNASQNLATTTLDANNATYYLNIDVTWSHYGYNSVSHSSQGFEFAATISGAHPKFLFKDAKVTIGIALRYKSNGDTNWSSVTASLTVTLNAGGNGSASKQTMVAHSTNGSVEKPTWIVHSASGEVREV